MQQPENQSKTYSSLFNAVDEGKIKVPRFQRDFVWDKEQTAKLIDSILKGFPIGTFILWETNQRFPHMRNIGNIDLPEPRQGDMVQYVLDGQQRITSLYAVRKGVRLTQDGVEIDYKDIAIDLSIDPNDEEEVVFESAPKTQSDEDDSYISVHTLLKGSFKELNTKFGRHVNRVSDYKQKLENYNFPVVIISKYSIDVACEIFTRINTTGKELTLFEIMVAKTYDEKRDFDLAERCDDLIKERKKSLESIGYETIPRVTILQCAAAYIGNTIKRKDILRIEKDQLIDSWDKVEDGLFSAIDYLRSDVGIVVSKILPYPTLLIPLTWFFIHKNGKQASSLENQLLRQYVYWASLTERFSSATETKFEADLKRIEAILEGNRPDYRGENIKIDKENLINQPFSAGSAFCKMIICLLSERKPKRFSTGGDVELTNKWLQKANSKNYHHFFPKAFLKSQKGAQSYGDLEANSVVNIVLIDDYLNKGPIKAKAPSEYMGKFRQDFEQGDSQFEEVLSTHYISSSAKNGTWTDEMGIWTDDYMKFLDERASRLADELNRILHPDIR